MVARTFWLLIGLLATGCGIAGIVLPLVPTTPFLLLAAYAFARSSPGLHHWLITHPRYGPPIRNWRYYGAISRRAKKLALLVILASFLASFAMQVGTIVLAVQAIVLAGVATFILTRPDAP